MKKRGRPRVLTDEQREANLNARQELNKQRARESRAQDPEPSRAYKRQWRAARSEEQKSKEMEYSKRHYHENRDEKLLSNRIWFAENAEKRREYKLRKSYGLTQTQYEQMFVEQKGLCAICARPWSRKLNVDHCHETGMVRALLCGPCNRALGLFKENIDTLERALNYLKLYHARKKNAA